MRIGVSTSRASAVGLAVLFVAGTAAHPLGAQPAISGAQTQEDRRTAMYREGVEAATAGRWTEARERFEAALAIRASPKVFFSLAQSEEQLGQLASAQADYARALAWARETTGDADVVQAAAQAQRALDARVPRIRLVVWGSGAATAMLDGRPVASGVSLPVDPGPHQVVIRAPGMRDVTLSAAIGEGQQLDFPVRLEPAEPPASAPAAHEPVHAAQAAPRVRWGTIGLVTGASGVVLLGAGAYFGIDAKSRNDASYAQGCQADNCPPAAAETRRGALAAATASTVLMIAGGVFAAGGVVLWLVRPAGPGRSATVAPVAFATGGGVAVAGVWQ